MHHFLLVLLGFCLGFGLAALLAAPNIQRPGRPGHVGRKPDLDLDCTYHYDR